MIRFLILGAGGAVPTPTHGQAAYWVELDGHRLLLDPGPGALVRLLASPHGPDDVEDVDGVLLSHLHLDHHADLAPLLFALHSPIMRQERPLQLWGPPGTAALHARLREIYGDWLTPRLRALEIHELEPGEVLVGAGRGTWRRAGPGEGGQETGPRILAFDAAHPGGRLGELSLGYVLADAAGRRLVFSGDTGGGPALTEAARGADVLVVECSTPDEFAMDGHLTPERVGRLCRDADPGLVVLTHLYPAAAALDLPALVGRHWRGPVIPARDGTLVTVPADAAAPEVLA
jgi:ribonuclease BN (tRNA processing enzyme)